MYACSHAPGADTPSILLHSIKGMARDVDYETGEVAGSIRRTLRITSANALSLFIIVAVPDNRVIGASGHRNPATRTAGVPSPQNAQQQRIFGGPGIGAPVIGKKVRTLTKWLNPARRSPGAARRSCLRC